MADVMTTFSSVSTDAPNVYISREMYRISERYLRFGKYASRYTLPNRFGKTIRINRIARMALPTAPLSEGVPPSAVGLSVQNVDVTLDQWGIVCFLTDVGLITTVHPMLQLAIDRTALAVAETLEREMVTTAVGGTAVIYANGKTTRANLVATDKVTTTTILTATVQLRALGAPEFDGGLYAGVIPPQVEGDMIAADATFQSAHNFVNVKALEYGEIGIWSGVRWARGNFLPIFAGVGAATSGGSATATVAALSATTGGAYTAGVTLSGGVIIVARDINTGAVRKISVANTTFSLGGSNTALVVAVPTSVNYTYDVYAPSTAAGSGAPLLAVSGAAAGSTVTITTLPTAGSPPAAVASGVEVFTSFILGKDAFGRVELNGMSLQSYITPAGASFSNPLAQGRKVGSKIMWKSFILDNTFMVRIESGSAFSAQLAA